MRALKKTLSIVFTLIITIVMTWGGRAVLAADRRAAVPEIKFAASPVTEYNAGDRVRFNIYSPNYRGLVEYRVILWDDNKKTYSDLWNEKNGYPKRYYTKWQPKGNTVFTLGWPVFEPGSYRITVCAKRVGIEPGKASLKGMNCDSYIQSAAFIVKPKVTILDKEGQVYGSKDEAIREAIGKDTKITANNIILSNSNIDGDLYISGNGVVIKNTAVAGKITVDPGEAGSCTLEKVTADSIEVLSGGKDSIHIRDVQADSMNINSSRPVRIEVDGDTEIISTSAAGFVIFDRKSGTYGTIRIIRGRDGIPEIEFRGNIKDKVIVETGAVIKTAKDSSVSNLRISTEDERDIIKLKGSFENVDMDSEAKLELAADTTIKRLAADKDCEIYLDKAAAIEKLEKDDNIVVITGEGRVGPEESAPVIGGGGYVPPVVSVIKVSSITVKGTSGISSITEKAGTLQMIATIAPNNATNKKIIWSVTKGTEAAEISGTGLLTAKADGTVTVRAAAQDGSGKFGEKVITISGQADIQVPGESTWIKNYTGNLSRNYGNNFDGKIDVAAASDGGYIVTGTTENSDILLLKAGANGGEQWRRTLGYMDNSYRDAAYSVIQTSDGGYIIAGSTMPKRNENDDNMDMLVIKTDSQGNKMWEKLYGDRSVLGGPAEVGYSIKGTKDGGYVITGSRFGETGWDVYLVKIGPMGEGQWSTCFNGINGDQYHPSWEAGFDVMQTSDGGYIVAGDTSQEQSMDNNIYVIKTDGSGNKLWDYYTGNLNGNAAYSVEETPEGYAVGGYCKTVQDTWDYCLIRLSKLGVQIGSQHFGQNQMNYGRGIERTRDGGCVITGTTYVDGVSGDHQIYVVKEKNGVKQWERIFGGSGSQESYSVRETADGGLIICGHTERLGNLQLYLIKTDSEGRVLSAPDIWPIDAEIKAANLARAGVVISYDNGRDVDPDKQWVTYGDDQALTAAMTLAAYNRDNVKTIQDVNDEVEKLNQATAAYNAKKANGTKGTGPVLVGSITVTADGGINAIRTDKGTLQLNADVKPSNAADKSITWSITNGADTADLAPSGLLTAKSNGSVTVRAAANDASGAYGEIQIEISGQTEVPEIIMISTAEQLQGINTKLDGYYKLANDIDLSSLAGGWMPIGDISDKFTGTFDGDNHIITGLSTITNRTYDVGLFGSIGEGAAVKNVGLEGAAVNSSQYITVGCLAGSNHGTITNSYTRGSVRGLSAVGGLVGANYGTIEGSYSDAAVIGIDNAIGGLVGSNAGIIYGCYATGRVSGYTDDSNVQGTYIGGLVGYNAKPGYIDNSFAEGEVAGKERVGGLVGYNSEAHINNCFVYGNVKGSDYVGGLVGFSFNGTIQNSTARNGNIIDNSRDGDISANFKRVAGYLEGSAVLNNNKAVTNMMFGYYVYNPSTNTWDGVAELGYFTDDVGHDQMNGEDITG